MVMDNCCMCGKRTPMAGKSRCHNCEQKIQADCTRARKRGPGFWKYIVWHTEVVGVRRVGNGKVTYEFLKREPYDKDGKLRLPAAKTIDLNKYCPGYDRDQIKHMKHGFMQAVGV